MPEDRLRAIFEGSEKPKSGRAYLVRGRYSALCYFIEEIRHGHCGMVITRQDPKQIKRLFNPETVKVWWLSELGTENSIKPNLQKLSLFISQYLENPPCPEPVVLLDGAEYLVASFGFKPVLQLLQTLHDRFIAANGVLLVPINVEVLKPEERAFLEAEFPALKEKSICKI